MADPLHCERHRVGHIQLVVAHQPGEHQRHENVEHSTDAQRPQNAGRHVLLGVLGLLRRRAYRIEADVSEEDQPRTPEDPAPPELAEVAGIGRNERLPVLGVHILEPENDEEQHHGELQDHDQVVGLGRLLDSHHENGGGE